MPMKQYDDSEYFNDSPEEIEERENEEKVRRMIRSEYRRIQSGEADRDMANDVEEEMRQAVERRDRKPARWFVAMRNVMTGEFLASQSASKAIRPVILMSLMFLASIFCILWNLSVGHERDNLEDEVSLLHDRAIRSRETVYQATSHLSISERISNRNLNLKDPTEPVNVIE